ncbi:MAG TPA: hypothetical protein VJR02_15565 [Pyrinomonadaceae bacterium]|nr:hypothetical protein [Pyrinomonadaceae bacterium]
MKSDDSDLQNQHSALRFHIVVFNFERIGSFLENFDKIHNFKPDRDRLIVLDCSKNHAAQKQIVAEFAQKQGWTMGQEVRVIRRRNWGIDQGARIDYIAALHRSKNLPRFIWQFQEHYLDLESPWSIWPAEMPRIGGQLKEDTLPDGVVIDLDLCEQIYSENPHASVIYADRAKLGIFTHHDGRAWFYADGANFSVRTTDVLEAFQPHTLSTYKSIYDGSYDWTLFMELDICRRLTKPGRCWYDLVTRECFEDPKSLRIREDEKGVSLHQDAEPFYDGLYRKYEERFERSNSTSEMRRWFQTSAAFSYVGLRTSRFGSVLNRLGIGGAARQFRRYIGD